MSTTGEPERRDPGEYLDDDPPRGDERRAAINALLATGVDWMRDRSRRVAHRYDLDADDILQLTWVPLLHSSTMVDLTNNGLRKWLAQRIDWAAKELARQRRHDGGERIDDEQLDVLLTNADQQNSDAGPPATAIDNRFLGRIGLTPHQVRVVLGECSGLDLSLRDYANLVGRSYAAIRKDKQRALDRIERWVGLSPRNAGCSSPSASPAPSTRVPGRRGTRGRSSAGCSTPRTRRSTVRSPSDGSVPMCPERAEVDDLRGAGSVDTMRRVFTRMAWRDQPVVHLRYWAADDALVARFLPLDGARRQYVHDALCVELDGRDDAALPTALAVTGFLDGARSPAGRVVRDLLGDLVWRRAVELSVSGDEEREVDLDAVERDGRLTAWREFARRPHVALGVGIGTTTMRAVLVDDRGAVLDRWTRALDVPVPTPWPGP